MIWGEKIKIKETLKKESIENIFPAEKNNYIVY